MAEMDPEVAKRLHAEGATLVVLDVPEGTEFGIDYFSWNVGPRFKGIKMIPSGLHCIYYSAVNKGGQTAPRTSLFLYTKRHDILVMRWDAVSEDVVETTTDEEEKEKYRQGNEQVFLWLGYCLFVYFFFFACFVLFCFSVFEILPHSTHTLVIEVQASGCNFRTCIHLQISLFKTSVPM